jgi:hypothetical protein
MNKVGRKQVYTTPEELKQAKKEYNKRYYAKLSGERRVSKVVDRTYTDEELLAIIKTVGYERIMHLLI